MTRDIYFGPEIVDLAATEVEVSAGSERGRRWLAARLGAEVVGARLTRTGASALIAMIERDRLTHGVDEGLVDDDEALPSLLRRQAE